MKACITHINSPTSKKTNLLPKHYHVSQWLGYCPHVPAHSHIRNMNYDLHAWKRGPFSVGSQEPLSLLDSSVPLQLQDFVKGSRVRSGCQGLTSCPSGGQAQRQTFWLRYVRVDGAGPGGTGDSIQRWGRMVRQWHLRTASWAVTFPDRGQPKQTAGIYTVPCRFAFPI